MREQSSVQPEPPIVGSSGSNVGVRGLLHGASAARTLPERAAPGPHLPPWLPEIALHGLCIGGATASIAFARRTDGTTDYNLLDVDGPLRVVRQPTPWSLTARFAERARDLVGRLLPGR